MIAKGRQFFPCARLVESSILITLLNASLNRKTLIGAWATGASLSEPPFHLVISLMSVFAFLFWYCICCTSMYSIFGSVASLINPLSTYEFWTRTLADRNDVDMMLDFSNV
jgi:hypothetical protein